MGDPPGHRMRRHSRRSEWTTIRAAVRLHTARGQSDRLLARSRWLGPLDEAIGRLAEEPPLELVGEAEGAEVAIHLGQRPGSRGVVGAEHPPVGERGEALAQFVPRRAGARPALPPLGDGGDDVDRVEVEAGTGWDGLNRRVQRISSAIRSGGRRSAWQSTSMGTTGRHYTAGLTWTRAAGFIGGSAGGRQDATGSGGPQGNTE